MPRSPLAVLIALSVSLFVACSGGEDSTPTPAPTTRVATATSTSRTETPPSALPIREERLDPCKLISFSELEEILGVDLSGGGGTRLEFITSCDVEDQDDVRVAELWIQSGVTLEAFRAVIQQESDAGTPFEGFTTAAAESYWLPKDGGGAAALHRDAFIQVTVLLDVSDEQRRDLSRALVDLLVERIDELDQALVTANPTTEASSTPAAGGTPPPTAPPPPEAPADPASLSFVDNLTARVDDGEWTLGEGLVATLQMLLGEAEPGDVLRDAATVDFEATGIVEMARAYLEDGDDPAARSEIADLLARIVYSPAALDRMAGIEPTDGDAAATQQPISLTSSQAASALEDCQRFFGIETMPEGVDQCLVAETFTAGGLEHRLYSPAPEMPDAGWTPERLTRTKAAIEHVVPAFQKLAPDGVLPIRVVFSVQDVTDTWAQASSPHPWVEVSAGERVCGVSVFVGAQTANPAFFEQLLAHELAHCFQNQHFPEQNSLPYEVIRWREEGMADHLSNVAYPTNDLEWRKIPLLQPVELNHPILSRSYVNFLFFGYIEQRRGRAGLFDLIASLPSTPGSGRLAQEEALASYPGMPELFQEFGEAMTDGTVSDQGKRNYDAFTQSRAVEIFVPTSPLLTRPLAPFGMDRIRLTVPAEREAALAFLSNEFALDSMRLIEDGSTWSGVLPALAASCDESVTIYLVVTTTGQDSSYRLDVPAIEELDCESNEAEPPTEFISGIDSCLVGEWRLDRDRYLRDITARDNIKSDADNHQIDGQTELKMSADGTLELAINGYEETHSYDRVGDSVIVADGSAGGAWGADGERLTTRWESLDVDASVTTFLGTLPLPGPPPFLLIGPAGAYICTDDVFEYTNANPPDGEGPVTVVWERTD